MAEFDGAEDPDHPLFRCGCGSAGDLRLKRNACRPITVTRQRVYEKPKTKDRNGARATVSSRYLTSPLYTEKMIVLNINSRSG